MGNFELAAAASPFKPGSAVGGHPLSTQRLRVSRSDVYCLWMQVGPPPPQVEPSTAFVALLVLVQLGFFVGKLLMLVFG